MQLPPVQVLVEVAQVIQTAGCGDGPRVRGRSPPQTVALGPHSAVVGEGERRLGKTRQPFTQRQGTGKVGDLGVGEWNGPVCRRCEDVAAATVSRLTGGLGAGWWRDLSPH